MNLILSIITYVIALIIIVSGLMKKRIALILYNAIDSTLLVFAIICIILGISDFNNANESQ
ncbi:MAG: hypothetical protein ACLUR5_10115 [Eubacterium ventriosum]